MDERKRDLRINPVELTNPDSREVCPGVSRSKDDIRREMRARRRALSADERAEASAVVCAKLARSAGLGDVVDPFEIGSPVAVYLASPDEIDLRAFIERLLWLGCKVVAPRWNGETYELAVLKGLDARHLRRGPMGIMEPVDAEIVPPKEVDGWIVPGLAFTRDGRRLGYGGGWYDRLLADAPKDAVKIGVAHSFQIVDDLPSEPHDIPLAAVVDDSLADRALDFRRTEGGYSARVAVPDLSFRRKCFAELLAAVVLLPVGYWLLVASHPAWIGRLSVGFDTLVFTVPIVAELILLVFLAWVFDGPVEAEITAKGREVVCRRRLLGFLPLPTRRVALTPWTWFDGGFCDFVKRSSRAASLEVRPFGELRGSSRPFVKTYESTALVLAIAMNRANRWDDAEYVAAREDQLRHLPFGMKIAPTADGQGMAATVHPLTFSGAPMGALIAVIVSMIVMLVLLLIPVVGIFLGLAAVAVVWACWLFLVLRGLFGFARMSLWKDRVECVDGLWPFIHKRAVPIGEFDTDKLPFGWLPSKHVFLLELFAESIAK